MKHKWKLLLFFISFILKINAVLKTGVNPDHVHLSLSSISTQMNVVWWTEDEPKTSVVQYGTSSSTYTLEHDFQYEEEIAATTRQVKLGTGFIHIATMVNLRPKTVYYYRVGSDSKTWSPEFNFKSKPEERFNNADDKVRFLAYGDMGVFEDSLNGARTIADREIKKENADFVLHVGDLAYAFENFTKWDMWFDATEPISTHVPYMICVGNRDDEVVVQERFAMPSDRSESTAIYKPQIKQNFYYSFDYNWVHVVAISSIDKFDKYDSESDQYKWIESDLKFASSRVNDPHDSLSWIIIMGHTPMYSSSDGHDGGNKKLRESIEPLLIKYNVSLGIWGDDHVYERTYPIYKEETHDRGTTEDKVQHFFEPSYPIHLLAGTSGIALDGWKEEKPPRWSAYREKIHGYLKIEATKYTLNGKFIRRAEGSVADEFVIEKGKRKSTVNWYILTIPMIVAAFFLAKRMNLCGRTSMAMSHPIESKST